jgi:hypothetical protein
MVSVTPTVGDLLRRETPRLPRRDAVTSAPKPSLPSNQALAPQNTEGTRRLATVLTSLCGAMVPDDSWIFLFKLIVEAVDFVRLVRRDITFVHCIELTPTRLVIVPVPDRTRTRMQRPRIFGSSS